MRTTIESRSRNSVRAPAELSYGRDQGRPSGAGDCQGAKLRSVTSTERA